MPRDEQAAAANETYNSLIEYFDRNNLSYVSPDNLTIRSEQTGEDLVMPFQLAIFPGYRMVVLSSVLPFEISDKIHTEMAAAICSVNNRLDNGHFEFGTEIRHMYFVLSNRYIDSPLSDETISYMVTYSLDVIDDFNDKFARLASGGISLEQFMDMI